jgi:hypothetical protein
MRSRIFHYVPYARALDWLACGWMVLIPNGPSYHLHYGIEMEWLCDCKMPRPK